ncbi:hypothetical protein J5N97_006355 [Dioscorea zingiberensis]|uniref:Secreted protein n=1 Tax=Dioscorea zingiberensis TaxID=325984 RepID=A0A9D5DBA5_9LILI|nr:hypothetical protein J5N97_006355 [Dioscorea zingiberensis]
MIGILNSFIVALLRGQQTSALTSVLGVSGTGDLGYCCRTSPLTLHRCISSVVTNLLSCESRPVLGPEPISFGMAIRYRDVSVSSTEKLRAWQRSESAAVLATGMFSSSIGDGLVQRRHRHRACSAAAARHLAFSAAVSASTSGLFGSGGSASSFFSGGGSASTARGSQEGWAP